MTSFISYLIFSISFILERIIQNINVSDNKQEITEHIEQQQHSANSEVIEQIENIQQRQMQSLASILQTSLSEFATSLGQLPINQSNKSPAEEEQDVTGKLRKRVKLMLNAQSMNLCILSTLQVCR